MQYIFELIGGAQGDAWHWFSTLTKDEWMVVLATGCALGFLCMRGFGSRSNF